MVSTGGRRRAAVSFTALVVALGLLGGCKQDNTPQAYDDVTRANFMQGCTGENTGEKGASQDVCRCAYEWFVDNVPINAKTGASTAGYTGPNFTDLDAQLKTDPTNFPQEITAALTKACPGWGSSGPENQVTTATTQASG